MLKVLIGLSPVQLELLDDAKQAQQEEKVTKNGMDEQS